MTRRAALGVLLGLGLGLSLAAAQAGDEGRLIYEGAHPLLQRATLAEAGSGAVPPAQAACVACHRPSGLGSFEGEAVVPPISSGLLASPYDPATTRRYAPSDRLRVRPAYDAAALQRLLAQGTTPDGRQVGHLMPRYPITLAQSAALLGHLNRLGTDPTPGVDDTEVHFATIVTDDVSPERERELLQLMQAFFVQKNAGTRAEEGRRASAARNEQAMYRRYRHWQLHAWRLSGPAAGWPAQLAEAYRRQPVFAVLSGAGDRDWSPVHTFCERERLPCLFPVTAQPGPPGGFYSAYFSGGVLAQAQWLGAELQATPAPAQPWLVLTGDDAESAALGQRIAEVLRHSGLAADSRSRWQGEPGVVSALTPEVLATRLPGAGQVGPAALYLLAGAAPPRPAAAALQPWLARTQVRWVTQQAVDSAALTRARAWWRGRAFKPQDEAFAAQVLFALTTAVETLVHVDERFSREYCLERLEHNLENMPPMTGYPRLSLGPGQRYAAKQVWLLPAR